MSFAEYLAYCGLAVVVLAWVAFFWLLSHGYTGRRTW